VEDKAPPVDTPPESSKNFWLPPHTIPLIAIWLISTITLAIMLAGGVRKTGQFRLERDILQSVYVLALFWFLVRTGPSLQQLPELCPVLLPRRRIGKLIPVIVLAFLFVFEFDGQGLVRLLILPATIWILIVWRREIKLPSILLGLALTTIALIAGLPFYQNRYFGQKVFIIFLVFVTPMFVAGGLLTKHTSLSGSQLYSGRIWQGVKSFLWGCLLFIPLGLTNAASGSPGSGMTWVTRWWIPFSQPFFSGIVEEAMWRLLLVSLCYLLLRPAFNKRPAIAIVCAVLFSAIIFGLGHGGTFLDRFLFTGLLYGLPMAVVFVRRDWEHAVGAHYMINMIPTLMVFLKA
jgi:hypothetical protein